MASVVALIGDVVGSRTARDRLVLHERLDAAIARVNDSLAPLTPLRITVGDEYQGVFADLGTALRATLRLRCLLGAGEEPIDVRHGLGRGEVRVLGEEPRVEDGSAWWAAREAIETVETLQRRPMSRSLRTAYAIGAEASDPAGPAVNAALTARDELVGALDARGLSVLSDMLAGMSQEQIAARLSVSASAVSQRVRRGGIGTVVAVDRLLGELP